MGMASFDSKTVTLTWNISYKDLTGDATAAHFHGPALPGKAAGVEVGIPNPVTSPIVGSATLTDAQAKDLLAGKFYFNVHTKANPKGEIRGQLIKTKMKMKMPAADTAK
jgi:hypothetical protein